MKFLRLAPPPIYSKYVKIDADVFDVSLCAQVHMDDEKLIYEAEKECILYDPQHPFY